MSRPASPEARYHQLMADWVSELYSERPDWEWLDQVHRELARLEKVLSGRLSDEGEGWEDDW